MGFNHTDKVQALLTQLTRFMDAHIDPASAVYVWPIAPIRYI